MGFEFAHQFSDWFRFTLACGMIAMVPALAASGGDQAKTVSANPNELVVWDGDSPKGHTWAKLGPKGFVRAAAKAGMGHTGRGLVLHFEGEGWLGCGLNWRGWYPPEASDDVSRFSALVFYIRQVTKEPDADLTIHLVDNVKRNNTEAGSNDLRIVADGGVEKIDGKWRRVMLPLSRFTLNNTLQLSRLWEIDFSINATKTLTFHIDRIGFSSDVFTAGRFETGPAYEAKCYIFPGKPPHKIEDTIYGVCGLPRDKLIEYRIPITRWGGNPSSRYNWKLGVDNGASDWFFKNRGKTFKRLTDNGYFQHIKNNQAIGSTTYQTVPMIGWVAKDSNSFSFSVSKYGRQKATEPGHPDVGNGVRPDGSLVTGNDPHDSSMETTPAYIEEAIRFVVQKAGSAANPHGKPGVKYWVLDNEPMLWHATHRDVHPEPLDYDGLWARTVRYGEAIKRADPTSKVAGFCSWGWTDLFYSAKDGGSDNYKTKADWEAHERINLALWYLQKCAEYRKHHGKALIDVFDFHWYPQGTASGQGPYLGTGMLPALNELRMRSTRDLWDSGYKQESWILNTDHYSPTALIPRIRKWIEIANPGMELCLGEYNFGGSDNITGGLAQAEVFGIMARERLDMAFIWFSPTGSQELAWKLFRNYDGKTNGFGDEYLESRSERQDLAIFAARRSADKAVTIVVINKNLHCPCLLNLDTGGLKGPMQIWRFDQESAARVGLVSEITTPIYKAVRLKIPAASASMIVMTRSNN